MADEGQGTFPVYAVMYIKSQILKEILKFVAPVMHFHFCQKYECLGAKNVVLHRHSVHFGLGTVSNVSCGNVLLPLGHHVTSTNTSEAAMHNTPARRTSWAIHGYLLIPPEGVHSSPIPQMLCIPPPQDL